MDPQKLSQLDPKLRDAYQRVMGTPIPQVQTQPASQRGEPVQTQTPPPPPGQPSPMPDPTPTPTPMPEPEPAPIPTIQEPPIAPVEPPVQPPNQASNFVQMNSEVASAPSQNFTTPSPTPQPQTIALKKKDGMMMPILFGVVGLVFVVVYTLFWTKIFNFQLPFLP